MLVMEPKDGSWFDGECRFVIEPRRMRTGIKYVVIDLHRNKGVGPVESLTAAVTELTRMAGCSVALGEGK